MRIFICLLILACSVSSCDQADNKEAKEVPHAKEGGSRYEGRVPLFYSPLWSDHKGDTVQAVMNSLGAALLRRNFGPMTTYESMGPAIYQTATSLWFYGGNLGAIKFADSRWFLHGSRVERIVVDILSDSTDLLRSLKTYEQCSQLLSDSFGAPIWTSAVNDRLFASASFSDRERAFFSNQAFQGLSQVGELGMKGLKLSVPSVQMWRWSNRGETWAITCLIRGQRKADSRGGEKVLYLITLELTPLPEIDLYKISPDLAKREQAYAGWINIGSDAWPNDDIELCEGVPDSVGSLLSENNLSPSQVLSTKRWYVYTGVSPGILQVMYASDTLENNQGVPNSSHTRGGRFFVRCTGVVFDTAETGYALPVLYVNRVLDIRRADNSDCS